jgi:hypothetical protein
MVSSRLLTDEGVVGACLSVGWCQDWWFTLLPPVFTENGRIDCLTNPNEVPAMIYTSPGSRVSAQRSGLVALQRDADGEVFPRTLQRRLVAMWLMAKAIWAGGMQ